MSAVRLREAATKLRGLADAATSGPWHHDDDGSFMGCGQVFTMGEHVMGGSIAAPAGDCYPRSGYSPKDDMVFIATMDPVVAGLLADWLDREAHWFDEVARAGGTLDGAETPLALAEAVLA